MEETLKAIKQELRAHMNGVASRRMREAGFAYHVNFGIEQPRLVEIAGGFSPSHELAQRLWHEDVRESKILAAMLMPTDRFDADLADIWASQIPNAEIAQTTVTYLFARLPQATELVFQWTASADALRQLCGLLLATRLLIGGTEYNERSRQELADQAHSLADSPSLPVRKAAQNLLNRIEL